MNDHGFSHFYSFVVSQSKTFKIFAQPRSAVGGQSSQFLKDYYQFPSPLSHRAATDVKSSKFLEKQVTALRARPRRTPNHNPTMTTQKQRRSLAFPRHDHNINHNINHDQHEHDHKHNHDLLSRPRPRPRRRSRSRSRTQPRATTP